MLYIAQEEARRKRIFFPKHLLDGETSERYYEGCKE